MRPVLIDVLRRAARVAPTTPAVVTPTETVTFAELAARVEARAAQVCARTEPGERVAVLAENCVGYVELYYAVPLAGRVLVPLNHRLHHAEWSRTMVRAGVQLL